MANATYIGVSSKARKVNKIYIGVNGVAKKVKKGYIGVNGVAKLIYSGGTLFDIAEAKDASAFMYPNNTANTTLNPSIGYTAGQYVYIRNEKNYITTSYLVEDPDLTGFTKLTITGYTSVRGGEIAAIFPAGTRVIQGGTAEASVVFGETMAAHTIDISSLNGKHALGFRFRNVGSRYIYIKKIELS